MEIKMNAIGYVESPYNEENLPPRQGVYNSEVKGKIKILDEYLDGLYSLKAGQEVEVFFNFHLSKGEPELKFEHHSGEIRGVFNTRSPRRPNGIGKSIIRIDKIEGTEIEFSYVDMLNGTPVLDIKPFFRDLLPEEK